VGRVRGRMAGARRPRLREQHKTADTHTGERDAAVAALGRRRVLLEVVVHEPAARGLHHPALGRGGVVRVALAERHALGHLDGLGVGRWWANRRSFRYRYRRRTRRQRAPGSATEVEGWRKRKLGLQPRASHDLRHTSSLRLPMSTSTSLFGRRFALWFDLSTSACLTPNASQGFLGSDRIVRCRYICFASHALSQSTKCDQDTPFGL
jgi:hypothetical protein